MCAHDCGLVVDPDALRNQIEGAVECRGSAATLHEEVQFDIAGHGVDGPAIRS